MSLIKKIRIKNFKNLEDVEIEVKPLTLLFGPNGSGKSSFIKAMMFLSKNLIPLNTEKTIYHLSEDVDLGCYKDIVTNNDVTKDISFEFDLIISVPFIKKSIIELDDYSNDSLGINIPLEFIEEFISDFGKESFFKAYDKLIDRIDYHNENFGNIDDKDLYEIGEMKIFVSIFFTNRLIGNNLKEIIIRNENFLYQKEFTWNNIFKDPKYYIPESTVNLNIFNDKFLSETFQPLFEYLPFESGNVFPDLPEKNKLLNLEIDPYYQINVNYNFEELNKWKNQSYQYKMNKIYELLKLVFALYYKLRIEFSINLLYKHIPLTRQKPKELYILNSNKFENEEYYGLLNELKDNSTLIEKVNYLLKKFEYNFKFDIKVTDDGNVARLLLINNTLNMNFSSASSGLIQLFPILVVCSNFKDWIRSNNLMNSLNYNVINLYIEQPELHLHPRLQSKLANLFSDSIKDSELNNTIFVETHSEHLIRKMQILIANGELNPDNLSVIYFNNKNGTTIVEKMEIEENGLFKKDWPDRFFDDSVNLTMELFEAIRKHKN